MKMYKWTAEIEIADTLVADGFDLTDERMLGILENALPYAFGREIRCKVIGAPDDADIAKEQGFASVAEFRLAKRRP